MTADELKAFTDLNNTLSGISTTLQDMQDANATGRSGNRRPNFSRSADGDTPAERAKSINAQKKLDEAIRYSTTGFISHQKQLSKLQQDQNDVGLASQFASKHMTEMVNTLDNVDLVTASEQFEATMIDMGKANGRLYTSIMQNADGTTRMAATADILGSNLAELTSKVTFYGTGVAEANKELQELGITTKDLTYLELAELREELKDLSTAAAKTTDRMVGVGTRSSSLMGKLTALGATAAAAGYALVDMARPAAKFGTNLNVASSILTGMNLEETAQLQADHGATIRALGMSYDKFMGEVYEGSRALAAYTGSLRDAVRVNADTLQYSTLFGKTQQEEAEFRAQQLKTFKTLNLTMNVTAEQFMEMNKNLMNNSDVQATLYKLDLKKRAGYFQDLQAQQLRLMMYGLEYDKAQDVISAFETIGGQGPKDRLKQAHRLRAMGASVGMGAESEELARLMERGFSEKGDKERAVILGAQIEKAIKAQMGPIGGAGEYSMQARLDATQMDKVFGPKGMLAGLIINEARAITDEEAKAKLDREQKRKDGEVISNTLIGVTDQIKSGVEVLALPLGAAVGLLSSIKTLIETGMAGSFLGGSGLGTGGGGAGKFGLAGKVIGGVGAAGMVLKDLYDVTQEDAGYDDVGGIIGGIAGGVLGSVIPGVGTAIGAGIGNYVGAEIGNWFDTNADTKFGDLTGRSEKAIKEREDAAAKYRKERDEAIKAANSPAVLEREIKRMQELIKTQNETQNINSKLHLDFLKEQLEEAKKNTEATGGISKGLDKTAKVAAIKTQ